MKTLRARFDGRVLVPVDPVQLPTDRILKIEVSDTDDLEDFPTGSPARLLQVMHRPPHLSREDARELEQSIEAGKIAPRYEGIFDEKD